MIFFNKYSPLSVFFPMGVIPVAPFLGEIFDFVGGIFGSNKASSSADKSAQIQAQGQKYAADTIYKQFQETKASLMPLADMTIGATEEQGKILGLDGKEAQQAAFDRYTESPGLAFAKQRGLDAVEQRYASRGALVSGAADKAVGEYIEGVQRQGFDNYFNKLGSYGNIGLTARQAVANVGSSAAAGQADLQSRAGESMAAGQLAKGKIQSDAIGNAASGLGSIYEAWNKRNG